MINEELLRKTEIKRTLVFGNRKIVEISGKKTKKKTRQISAHQDKKIMDAAKKILVYDTSNI